MILCRLQHIILLSSMIGLADVPPPIRLPVGPVVPQPMPPAPGAVTSLTAEQVYIIDSDVPCIVLASPPGLVTVIEESGPVKIRAKFVDGLGKTESRTYKGKSVFSVEAVTTGRVELLIVPIGGFTTDVIRRSIDVTAGEAPRPPPPPKPDPKPAPAAQGKLSVVAVLDRKVADPAQAQALASDALRTFLAAGGHEMDLVDIGTSTGQAQAATYAPFAASAKVSAPYLLVMDQGSKPPGLVLSVVSLPSKDADILTLLKGLSGK